MQLESSEDVIRALRHSGLFTPEQFTALLADLSTVKNDPTAIIKFLVSAGRLTRYQLKKTLLGKSAYLFVGPYIVADKLGDGATGKVFRAVRHVGGAEEVVALKVIRAALIANPVIRGRFEREAQTARTLDHPNIVRLRDAGDSNGRFYLAMEFVDGTDLAKLVAEYGGLDVAEACEYVRQVALGLQHAHGLGIIHRDVKPSNIVVAGSRHRPGASGPALVKILDFGLARTARAGGRSGPDLTRDYSLLGTPDYIAPEQAKDSKRADARCDLYSLGCTLYFLLTGRVPFPQEGAIHKIVAHRGEVAAPVQALRREIPDSVAQLVARLMAKQPEDRVQTAGEVAAALEPFCRFAPAHDETADQLECPRGVTPRLVAPSPARAPADDPLPVSPGLDAPTLLDPHALPGANPPRLEYPIQAPPTLPGNPPRAGGPHLPKRRRQREPERRGRFQIIWLAVALLGVAVLALMLWIVSQHAA